MRTPKGPNVRIACCTFKNQRASAVILETKNSTSGGIWFSTQRLLRNLLSLIQTNDDHGFTPGPRRICSYKLIREKGGGGRSTREVLNFHCCFWVAKVPYFQECNGKWPAEVAIIVKNTLKRGDFLVATCLVTTHVVGMQ